MDYFIIIPAHNEEGFLEPTLNAVFGQHLLPKKVVVVNDNSTDGTEAIIDQFCERFPNLIKLNITSPEIHLPGSKVVNAFSKGLKLLDDDYGFMVKLDADIVLPPNYFERVGRIFNEDPKVGIAGGFAYEKDESGRWKLNHPMNKDHVRGAFKAYGKSCFEAIGGLRSAMGWDTVDELLAKYHGFKVYTDASLQVRHLRPTGNAYSKKARLYQGKAMYTMRYGFFITVIASLKMAIKQGKTLVFFHNLRGYLTAKGRKVDFMVTEEEGRFIRKYRWQGILKKLT
ncbi:MAG: glycosyltransferase family 2 protein [Flavobacteriaceae bacterium]